MRILVTGATGQLGQAMVRQLRDRHDVRGLGHRELDIACWPDVQRATAASRPDAIVNCAAYNDVNAAEDSPLEALAANAWGPRALARAAGEIGATLVHFSTDFVFDGRTDRPYTETDPPLPQGRYGMSKLLGEWLAAEVPGTYVLRVESLFGGPRAKSSVDALLDAILEGRPARPFSDRTVSPSYVDDVVLATAAMLETRPAPGLYHCVNSGFGTWLEVAQELARLAGRSAAPIQPMRLAEANLRPPRPLFAALSNAKLAAAGIAMPSWQDALERYVRARTVC